MSSRRQQLVDAVRARLAGISTDDDYQTDLGARRHEWLGRRLTKNELPAHNVRDLECRPHYASGTDPAQEARHVYRLRFVVDLIFDEGEATAADARKGLADVRRAIGLDPTWKDDDGEELASETILVEERVVTDREGNWLGGARIEFLVAYHAEAWGET